MDKQVSETTLLRKSILGIRVIPFTCEPLFKINNWNVFDAGRVNLLPPEERNLNINYQVERGAIEKILIRIFLTPDKSAIRKANYYFILNNTDSEQTHYLALSVVKRMRIPMSHNFQLNRFGF
jgi:hypothetical protein